MKRYHIFSYYDYYPSGGMGDYKGGFETLEEALAVEIRVDNADLVELQEDGALKTIYEWQHREERWAVIV